MCVFFLCLFFLKSLPRRSPRPLPTECQDRRDRFHWICLLSSDSDAPLRLTVGWTTQVGATDGRTVICGGIIIIIIISAERRGKKHGWRRCRGLRRGYIVCVIYFFSEGVGKRLPVCRAEARMDIALKNAA